MGNPSPADFIGVLAILGGDIAESSVKFANAYPVLRLLTSMLVVPGLHKVAILLLKRNGIGAGLALSPGIREDRKRMTGFKGNYKYRYVGMMSGTNAPVANPVFEAWLNVKNRSPKDSDTPHSRLFRCGPNMGKHTVLRYTNIKERLSNGRIRLYTRGWRSDYFKIAATIILQIGALASFFIMIEVGKIMDGLVPAIVIILCNWVSYSFIVMVVAVDGLYFASNNPSADVPIGNCIVTDVWGESIWAVNAEEKVIQDMLRDEIAIEDPCAQPSYVKSVYKYNRNTLEFAAAVFGLGTTVATVLVTPLMSTRGKIFLAIELFIGMLACMVSSSRDNESTLSNIAESYYHIGEHMSTKFTNRATAVAAAVLFTKGRSTNVGENFLPRTEHFNSYRQILDYIVRMTDSRLDDVVLQLRTELTDVINNGCVSSNDSEARLARVLERNIDLHTLKPTGNSNMNEWPQRLVTDIIEAFVHVHILLTVQVVN